MRSDPSRAGWGLRGATWAAVLFLHIPLALIILYAFSAEDKSYVFPPPALTTQWFAVAWEREDVWAAHLALPDWDMFHSGHAAGAYHAAARAISGGPVYISDVPGKHDAALLRRLCAGDGRALRCAQLDRDDPTRILARTPRPLLRPRAEDRGGYVPNVIYSCGAFLSGRDLLVPHAVGDHYTAFATTTIDRLLAAMT